MHNPDPDHCRQAREAACADQKANATLEPPADLETFVRRLDHALALLETRWAPWAAPRSQRNVSVFPHRRDLPES